MSRLVAFVALLLLAGTAFAHKPSDSYLELAPVAGGVRGQWRIGLRDLHAALDLDTNGDGALTWGELRAQHERIATYATARLTVSADGQRCRIVTGAQLVERLSDGAYTVLPLIAECAAAARFSVDYALFFDLDPTHRGILAWRTPSLPATHVLSRERHAVDLEASDGGALRQGARMLVEGIWHIWIGADHVLFLLALLIGVSLPVARRNQPAALEVQTWLKEVLVLVTTFTVAHSVTLSLAALNVVSLPPRLIETAIAVSIVVAAMHLRFPLLRATRPIAFVFGLIHGFGFANVLADLDLPTESLVLSLFGFNAGVEVGQCAIVLAAVPILWRARRTAFFARAFAPAVALVIAAIGVVWIVERGFDIDLG